MMRITAILFLFFSIHELCYAQNTLNCITEKTYHNNGQIETIQELDSVLHCNCGNFQEFDTTGTLILEGQYKIVDSIECKGCYEGSMSFGNDRKRGNWNKIEFEDACSLRIGIWKTYHPNGKLKTIGEYSSKIHSSYSAPITDFDQSKAYLKENNIVLYSSGPINVGVSYEELKDGVWHYFDENGKKIKVEEYIDGDLIFTKDLYGY